jgi:tetratricopeptide (TPR) repeat protein
MSTRPACFRPYWWLAVLGAIALGPASVRAADPNWLDLEGRIQYGYFTEDPRALQTIAESLGAPDSHNRLKSYYVGLLAYRAVLLAEERSSAAATEAKAHGAKKKDPSRDEVHNGAQRCVSALDQALRAQSDFADALALKSACLSFLGGSWRSAFAAPKSEAELRKALELAPKNPRVLLLDALAAYEREEVAPRSCDKFKSTAAMFDAERADVDQVPGWGAAEAYMWLGRCYLDKGDVVPARDALERALFIAPEFAQARRLLSSITSG